MAFLTYLFLTDFVFLYRERNTFCCWNNQSWFWRFSETFLWTRGNCYSSSSYVSSVGPCIHHFLGQEYCSSSGDNYAIGLLAQLGIYLCIFYRIEAACNAHPTADVFINFASFRRLAIISIILFRKSDGFE